MRHLAILALLLAACEPIDAGRQRSEVTGRPLTPIVLPMEVVVDPAYSGEDGPIVNAALRLWQGWERCDGVPHDWLDRAWPPSPEPQQLGQAWVTRGFLPTSAAAQTTLDENRQGEIRWATIVFAHDWVWADDETRIYWVAHEMGHVLGLADDPGDLFASVMASPTQTDSGLTAHDCRVLTGE